MANQLGKFSPNLAECSQPLRELLSPRKAWVWGPVQEEAFLKVKEELTKPHCVSLGEFCHNMSYVYEYTTPVEPMLQSSLPSHAWEKVGTDLFQLKDSMYQVVVDYYSRYAEIQKLTSRTSAGVISALKAISSQFSPSSRLGGTL